MSPPPPPPGCFPFTRSKTSRSSNEKASYTNSRTATRPSLSRSDTVSSTSTLTSKAEKLTFTSDSISWNNIPIDNTTRPSPKRFGSGSSRGKEKDAGNKEKGKEKEKVTESPIISPVPSRNSSQRSPPRVLSPVGSPSPSRSSSNKSKNFFSSLSFSRTNSSSDTLVGSAFERKVADAQVPPEPKLDTGPRVEELRKLMLKEKIDYYVVPSTDAHGSEYIAPSDKRRQWLSGFTGSAGTAVVSATHAYLFTDSRYYIQAARELDTNWTLQKVGWEGKKDWDDWLIDRAKGVKVGVDSRLISYALAEKLNKAFIKRGSHLVYPWQNLVDLLWKDRPFRPKDPVYVQPMEFAGEDVISKLAGVREWIRRSAPETAKYSANPPPTSDIPVAALIHNLSDVAWSLNLRGSDIPYNPVFHAYLFVSLDNAILFVDSEKVAEEVREYLTENGVSMREYSDVWPFLRGKEWGEGKVLITDDVPFTVPRSLTSMRYHIVAPYISQLKSVKNRIELDGMAQAYLRDGAAMVRWLAWLDEKIAHGYEITEYEAAYRLEVFRSDMQYYQGPAYESISASGPNAALPHYVPPRQDSRVLDRATPYLIDSGGQYRDGTCDTTRTVHFGRPTNEQCEAYTRVLQGHIGIDSAVFPEGTTGKQLDVLARRALWQDGLNYLHGTGHGVGSFLNVHEEPYFGKDMVFQPGQVISNEPGFYHEGDFGVRIESVMVVKRVKTKYEFQGDIWLGFERLTQVPIQVKMIKATLLSKEERAWVRNHNEDVRKKLEPLLSKDKRALKWLRKECQPAFRSETSVSGVSVEWD